MKGRRRICGLALVALAVPFPALALDGGGTPSSEDARASLTVSASLDGCGLAGTQILCKINTGWNALDGADNYTMSVTGADGSVVDYGETSGQGSSVWVPYVGPGMYSVTVTAWGTPPDEEEEGSPEVIARSSSESSGISAEVAKEQPAPAVPGETRELTDEVEVAEEPAAIEGESVVSDTRDVTPTCEKPPVEETPPPLPPEEIAAPGAEDDEEPPAQEVVDTIPGDDDCAD
ncbi:MAG: hypothetical protein M3355_04445 [Actinomycetota bacterium]|nr:hypothetical protein [Actinomycetota bacterium]